MSNGLPRMTLTLLRLWARCYTVGLNAALRADRLARIESDVWEHLHGEGPSRGGLLPTLSVLERGLRGAPADLTWRLFDAGRLPATQFALSLEGGPEMTPTRSNPIPLLAMAAGMAWAVAFVLLLQPVPHSLAYASAFLGLVALGGWCVEARERDEDAPGLSVWPLLLAAALALIAAGLLFGSARAGLLIALPLALGLSVALFRAATRQDREATAPFDDAPVPLPAPEIAVQAGSGAAIAIERTGMERRLARRTVLRGGVMLSLFSGIVGMGGLVTDFLYRRDVAGFGGVVTAGPVNRFPPGTKTRNIEGKFWLVNLTPEQGGPGFLALWQKCPHLGCVVPWEAGFRFTDPQTNQLRPGWFRCGCHQSTYNDAGVRVYGPATRSMDRMAVSISPEGIIQVNTGEITNGTTDNAAHAVQPPA